MLLSEALATPRKKDGSRSHVENHCLKAKGAAIS